MLLKSLKLCDDTAANLAIARLEKALSDAGISDNQTVGEYMSLECQKMIDAVYYCLIWSKKSL
jgi:hypothetical protein